MAAPNAVTATDCAMLNAPVKFQAQDSLRGSKK